MQALRQAFQFDRVDGAPRRFMTAEGMDPAGPYKARLSASLLQAQRHGAHQRTQADLPMCAAAVHQGRGSFATLQGHGNNWVLGPV